MGAQKQMAGQIPPSQETDLSFRVPPSFLTRARFIMTFPRAWMRNWWCYDRNPGPFHGRDRALQRRNTSSGCVLSGRKGFSACYVHEHVASMGIGRTLMFMRRA